MRAEREDPSATGGSDPSPSVGRRTVLASGTALGASAVAGCLGGGIEAIVGDAFDDAPDASVAIVSSPEGFDGTVDRDAVSGVRIAASEYDLDVEVVEEADPIRYERVQAALAEEGHDLIVCIGAPHRKGLEANAAAYPDRRWALVGGHFGGPEPVSAWIGMRNEMAFLAGVAAGTLTREAIELGDRKTKPDVDAVGFVGYAPDARTEAIGRSYVEGVEWVHERTMVLASYVAGFLNPRRMWIRADRQYRAGADVVYQAHPGQTEAVFAAAQENDRFALGTDVDPDALDDAYADVFLGSAVTAYDAAAYRVVEAFAEDDWGRVRGDRRLGVGTGGVGFVTGPAFEGGDALEPYGIDELRFGDTERTTLPDSLYENLERAAAALADGTVELACGPKSC